MKRHMLSRVEPSPIFIAGHALEEAQLTCSGPGSCGQRILHGQEIVEVRPGEYMHDNCVPEESDDGER